MHTIIDSMFEDHNLALKKQEASHVGANCTDLYISMVKYMNTKIYYI